MALIDQAEAASADAARIMAGLAHLESTTVRHEIPGPVHLALIRRLNTKALAGQLTLCPDLSWVAPRPSFWCAWAPGRLRCEHCADATGRRIRGTAEDLRCDHCHNIGPVIHRGAIELPPVVVDLPDKPRCIPPITMLFGLCPACHRTDSSAAVTKHK